MQLIPIVIIRISNFYTRTFVRIAQLLLFKENSPDALTYKTLPTQAQTIAMTIRIHAQGWLTLMFKVSRSNLTQPRKTKKHVTHDTNDKHNKATIDPPRRPRSGKYKRRRASGGGWNRGGDIRIVDHAYEGPGVINPHMDGTIA